MSDLAAILRRLQRRVANMVFRGHVTADDDSPAMQEVQVDGRAGEVKDGLEHWQPYGMRYRVMPPDGDGKGAEVLVVAVEPDLRVVLPASDRRYPSPVALAPGELVLFDRLGKYVHFRDDGRLEIVAPEIALIAGASSIVMTGAQTTIATPSYDLNES